MASGCTTPALFFDEDVPGFGQSSLFDVQYTDFESVPMTLPVARYLNEALLGMCGAPVNQSNRSSESLGSRAEASASWHKLKRALSTESAKKVCATLAWLCLGVLFDVVSDTVTPDLRADLSRSWFAFTAGPTEKSRDFVLDSCPTVLVQAIYRMMVDAFPPEYNLLTNHAGKVVEKLGIVVNKEVSGVFVSTHTADELRRKLFTKPILDHPYNDLVEARRKGARDQMLMGHKIAKPLVFGSVDTGQPLDELQMEHVLEQRAQELKQTEANGRGRRKRIPTELSVDRYLHLSDFAEEMFMRQLTEINPESAAAEALEQALAAAEAKAVTTHKPEVQMPDSPKSLGLSLSPRRAVSPLARRESPGLSHSPTGAGSPLLGKVAGVVDLSVSPRSHRESRSSRGTRKKHKAAEAAERRRRDELFVGFVDRPLPECFTQRSLLTGGTSPLLQHLAPWSLSVTTGGIEQRVRMVKQKEQLLPKIPSAPTLASCSRPPGDGNPSKASASKSFLHLMHASQAPKQGLLPKINEASPGFERVAEPPLRLKREIVMQRMQLDKAGFESQSFEAHRRDHDIMTGEKRTRLDGERLAREERETLQRHYALLGSRSAPALKRLGCERRAKAAAALLSSGTAAVGQPSHNSQQPGGAVPRNQVANIDWSTTVLSRMVQL